MRFLCRKWDFFLAALISMAGLKYLPTTAVQDVTTELIAFFSIQSAVILPAMIFTAGILKPDGLELKDAQRYHQALRGQMEFWVTLLGLNFIAVVALISGKALKWTLPIIIPDYMGTDTTWNACLIIIGIFYFSGSLALFRAIPFIQGVLSLLDLNSNMTIKAINKRQSENNEAHHSASKATLELPVGYGKILPPDDKI